ncbi:MAG: proline--tRNA ligase [Phycisphaerales bacterium]|nr:proline--tRNA ligase [Phycisphaerales bacterium]
MSEDNTSAKRSVVTATRYGVTHYWSKTLIPTTREAPNDAETPSHILLHRAGFIRQVGAGIYDYLPLAWRTLRKISDIVREEMDAAGGSEMLMPALEPFELFDGTKRHEDYGDNLFRVKDRKGRMNALAPTHEEVITQLLIGSVSSYKALPLTMYQIQTKFRDEARPRAGLLRCREFMMKDAYTFHTHVEGPGGLNEAYDAMYRAYTNIFTRCGLDFTAVEAESGPIGGSASHEFMVNCKSGEDTILRCPVSGYAANVEKCEIGERARGTFTEPATGELTEVHTPNLPGIDEVGKAMGVKPDRMLKTLVFAVKEDAKSAAQPGIKWVLAVVKGSQDANEGKVKSLSGLTVTMADEKAARAAGFAIGYVSPRAINSVPGTMLLIDSDASLGGFWASGADKADYHVKHFSWQREVGAVLSDSDRVKVGDLRNAMEGDPSPRAAGSKLVTGRGIEVGHIFKLGTKYSDAMGFQILDPKDNTRKSVIMGCYGIGVSRTMAACVEMANDENGIIWPAGIAPYHVLIVMMKPDDARQREMASKLACELVGAGVDVLVDDRDERPGVKFKDADLVGIPVRLTLGDKALDAGGVEFKLRKDTQSKGDVVPVADVVGKCLAALNA